MSPIEGTEARERALRVFWNKVMINGGPTDPSSEQVSLWKAAWESARSQANEVAEVTIRELTSEKIAAEAVIARVYFLLESESLSDNAPVEICEQYLSTHRYAEEEDWRRAERQAQTLAADNEWLCHELLAAKNRLMIAEGLWRYWCTHDITVNEDEWAGFSNAVQGMLDGKPVDKRWLSSAPRTEGGG